MGILMLSYSALFLATIFAFAVSTVAGGGAGLVLLPLLGIVLSATQVPAALSIGTVSSSFSRIIIFRHSIRWDVVCWFVPPALPFAALGSWLLSWINPLYLDLLLGCFLAANLIFLFHDSSPDAAASPPLPNAALALIGAAAGFLSGFTGAVGLVFNQFYLRNGMRKEEIVATRAANEILLHLVKLILYFSFGLLTEHALLAGTLVAVAAVIASFIMQRLLPYISEIFFRRVGYLAMCMAGVLMFSISGSQLMAQNNIYLDYSHDGSKGVKLHWQQSALYVEFNHLYNIKFERIIRYSFLPSDIQSTVIALSQNAEKIIVVEVFGLDSHAYEINVYKGNNITKYHL
jgi:uncharacterized membrane protein YfcA